MALKRLLSKSAQALVVLIFKIDTKTANQ